MRYAFINRNRHAYTVRTMCRVLRVSRSGFYEWAKEPVTAREKRDEELLGLIRDSYDASTGAYGSPRVFADLKDAGEKVSRKRVARLMKAHECGV